MRKVPAVLAGALCSTVGSRVPQCSQCAVHSSWHPTDVVEALDRRGSALAVSDRSPGVSRACDSPRRSTGA